MTTRNFFVILFVGIFFSSCQFESENRFTYSELISEDLLDSIPLSSVNFENESELIDYLNIKGTLSKGITDLDLNKIDYRTSSCQIYNLREEYGPQKGAWFDVSEIVSTYNALYEGQDPQIPANQWKVFAHLVKYDILDSKIEQLLLDARKVEYKDSFLIYENRMPKIVDAANLLLHFAGKESIALEFRNMWDTVSSVSIAGVPYFPAINVGTICPPNCAQAFNKCKE